MPSGKELPILERQCAIDLNGYGTTQIEIARILNRVVGTSLGKAVETYSKIVDQILS